MDLYEIVSTDVIENNYIESTMIGGVICPLIRIHGYKVVLYGCGRDIDSYITFFHSNGLSVFCVIDEDEKKEEKHLKETKCISLSKARGIDFTDCFCIITTSYFVGLEQFRIIDNLKEIGLGKYYSLNEGDRLVMVGSRWGEGYYGRTSYFRDNYNDLKSSMDLLYDNESKEVFKEYIRIHIQNGIYSRKQIDGRLKYFYDDNGRELYRHLEEEVWINCGAGIGDSVFLFFDAGLKAKRILAYEGEKLIYDVMCNNLQYLPESIKNVVVPINEYINASFDFNIYIDQPITLINADIEGNELEMLIALKDIIKKDRPVMSICVYHKKDDLIEIPRFLNSFLNNYKYILRKYVANVEEARQFTELVLYAIPDERVLI